MVGTKTLPKSLALRNLEVVSSQAIIPSNRVRLIPIVNRDIYLLLYSQLMMESQGTPSTIFHRSLDRFKISLTDREKEDFELTSLDEVHSVVLQIQKEHASERKMQNMARIQAFLEGMEQYGNVIEIFLNVSVFVAFVWVGHDLARARHQYHFQLLTNSFQGSGKAFATSEACIHGCVAMGF